MENIATGKKSQGAIFLPDSKYRFQAANLLLAALNFEPCNINHIFSSQY